MTTDSATAQALSASSRQVTKMKVGQAFLIDGELAQQHRIADTARIGLG